MITIEFRKRQLVNTDPQRRCYNGAHYSSELVWTPWELLEHDVKPEHIEERLEFWRRLTAGAVKARGEGSQSEFRVVGNENL